MWDELQSWLDKRPKDMTPVKMISKAPFPTILFVHWAAISSNQLYHTTAILLLSNKPKTTILVSAPVSSPIWHAKRSVGTSETNPHHGCLNNAIQPLWIAGRLLGHTSEHDALVMLIKHIETTTGWGMSWRIRDLEEAWGYDAGTYSTDSRAGVHAT